METTERLVNLVALLADAERPLTAAEIMAAVPGYEHGGDAARRMFERDKVALREVGLALELVTLDPLASEEGPDRGYLLAAAREVVADPGLSVGERSALVLAAAIAGGAGGPLGAEISDEQAAGTGPPAIWGVDLADSVQQGLVDLLMVAISERRRVKMAYATPGTPVDVKERELCPYGLARRRGHWYVVGEDSLSGEVRSFRLDRIQGSPSLGGTAAFSRPERFSALEAVPERGWAAGTVPAVTATLAVDPDWSWWVVPQANATGTGPPAEVAGEQWLTLSVEVRNTEAFCSWVLSLLDTAVVLGPEELREAVVERLDALLEQQ